MKGFRLSNTPRANRDKLQQVQKKHNTYIISGCTDRSEPDSNENVPVHAERQLSYNPQEGSIDQQPVVSR
jgi:hypothetical protein